MVVNGADVNEEKGILEFGISRLAVLTRSRGRNFPVSIPVQEGDRISLSFQLIPFFKYPAVTLDKVRFYEDYFPLLRQVVHNLAQAVNGLSEAFPEIGRGFKPEFLFGAGGIQASPRLPVRSGSVPLYFPVKSGKLANQVNQIFN